MWRTTSASGRPAALLFMWAAPKVRPTLLPVPVLGPPRWGLALLLSPMNLYIIHWSVIDLEYELVLSMGYLPLPEEPTKRQKRQK